jgi:hypothetical protein
MTEPWSIATTIATIVSGITDFYQFTRNIFQRSSSQDDRVLVSLQFPPNETSMPKLQERYQVLLGRRHKFLREEILKINPREMADFYGFEKVSYLEDCEDGLDEFPTTSLEKLEKFFFVNPKYFQEGDEQIFNTFDIICTSEDCRYYLEEGFKSYFLCDPDFKRYGFAYLIFLKKDRSYYRIICSNTWGSFYSSGGGYHNIANLIRAMLDLNISLTYVSFSSVDEREWKLLEKNCWYVPSRFYSYRGDDTWEAQDIFERWYKEIEKVRKG